jgi:hypothetical protein
MRMAPMNYKRGLIKTRLKELLIGFDDEARRNASIRIRQHAIGGDDGEAFDAKRASHGDLGLPTAKPCHNTRYDLPG